MKTVNIKGKEYVEVSERLIYFRTSDDYKGYSLTTEMLHLDTEWCCMVATIRNAEGVALASGTAYEKANSTYINKTSYIENCETSAWGRALGNLGIGITAAVASADEVINAIANQGGSITTDQATEINDLINESGADETKFLQFIGAKSVDEIPSASYAKAVTALKKKKGVK